MTQSEWCVSEPCPQSDEQKFLTAAHPQPSRWLAPYCRVLPWLPHECQIPALCREWKKGTCVSSPSFLQVEAEVWEPHQVSILVLSYGFEFPSFWHWGIFSLDLSFQMCCCFIKHFCVFLERGHHGAGWGLPCQLHPPCVCWPEVWDQGPELEFSVNKITKSSLIWKSKDAVLVPAVHSLSLKTALLPWAVRKGQSVHLPWVPGSNTLCPAYVLRQQQLLSAYASQMSPLLLLTFWSPCVYKPHLKMQRLWPSEIKSLAQGHSARKQQSWEFYLRLVWAPSPCFWPLLLSGIFQMFAEQMSVEEEGDLLCTASVIKWG